AIALSSDRRSDARPRGPAAIPDDALQARAETQRVLAEQLAARGVGEALAPGDLLHALRPRGVAVRPVGREQPEVFAQFFDAELQRALPRVDGVEVAAL